MNESIRFSLAVQGWEIIKSYSDPRESAKMLCHWLSDVLKAETVGLEFYGAGENVWREQVVRIGVDFSTGRWKEPFPEGESYWYFNGGREFSLKIKPVLEILTEQWLHSAQHFYLPNKLKQANSLTHPLFYNTSWISISPASRAVLFYIQQFSQSLRPLLLVGGLGSGREHLAHLIHCNSSTPSLPFSYIRDPEEEGTLFIPDWQKKSKRTQLLLLQDPRRVIASATPEQGIHKIKQEWLHSTNGEGLLIEVPSLRERLLDLPLLASHFIEVAADILGRPAPDIPATTMTILKTYSWPGSTQELKKTMFQILERLPVSEDLLELCYLPPHIRRSAKNTEKTSFVDYMAELEMHVLQEELIRQNGNITETARVLGFTPRQVKWRVQKYTLSRFEKKRNDESQASVSAKEKDNTDK